VGVSTAVTSQSTADDAERSDDVDDGVSVDLPQWLTIVVAVLVVVATGLRSADSVRILRLLTLTGENPGNLLALDRLT